MKRIALGLAAAVFAMSAAAAQEAMDHAKTMDTSAGKVWADEKGMTLYTFDKDAKNKSNCDGDCAKMWPPHIAAAGATGDDEWSIVDRTDGTKMWAYEGKPVYTYAKDTKPGDVNGNGVGGVWHIAEAD